MTYRQAISLWRWRQPSCLQSAASRRRSHHRGLVLREPKARDRAAFIELLASPEVGTYLGGPQPRNELEREMPGAPKRRPGLSSSISAEP